VVNDALHHVFVPLEFDAVTEYVNAQDVVNGITIDVDVVDVIMIGDQYDIV
jgi:hypothetical protein